MRSVALGLGALCVLLTGLLAAPPVVAVRRPPLFAFASPHERFGFAATRAAPPQQSMAVEKLNAGWFLNYRARPPEPGPAGLRFVHTVRVGRQHYDPLQTPLELALLLAQHPGGLWLIGNEPDRTGLQDDRTPAEYATIYHDLYWFIKTRDPGALVANGGIVQPTPLRLQYLDLVLASYEAQYGTAMPVDVWNIHNMILREERDSWGAGIPPGLSADRGRLYEIQDNDSLPIFQAQIVAFRAWMAANGQRDKPLIVSEYGVLMPQSYGFSVPRVILFMRQTFDYLLTASDPALGYPADDNRLVQMWAWYSLDDWLYDPDSGSERGFNGSLFERESGAMTPFGVAYGSYTAADLRVVAVAVEPALPFWQGQPTAVTLRVQVANAGLNPAGAVVVHITHGHSGALLAETSFEQPLAAGHSQSAALTFWLAAPGLWPLQISVSSAATEAAIDNNHMTYTLMLPTTRQWLPLALRAPRS